MLNRPKKQNISIHQLLGALVDDSTVFPPAYLRHFSDLEGENLAALRSVWPQVNPIRRFDLLEDLEEIADNDTLVLFDAVAKMALEDEDPRVRTIAVRMLWESEDEKLADVFLKMLVDDPSINVRAAAATALGQYIYQGELEEIPEDLLHRVEDQLLQTVSGKEETLVRRRALESLGFSSRKEVSPIIRSAYELNDPDWLISALYAMGRSADASWAPEVKRMLRHSQTTVQIEAVRAAGELELEATRHIMLQLLDDELQDIELRFAIYWSLSKIGGDDVRETLETRLEETEDDEEAEALEDALANLDFTEEIGLLNLMDIDDVPLEDEAPEEYLLRSNARVINLDEEEAEADDTPLDKPSSDTFTDKKSSSGNQQKETNQPD